MKIKHLSNRLDFAFKNFVSGGILGALIGGEQLAIFLGVMGFIVGFHLGGK